MNAKMEQPIVTSRPLSKPSHAARRYPRPGFTSAHALGGEPTDESGRAAARGVVALTQGTARWGPGATVGPTRRRVGVIWTGLFSLAAFVCLTGVNCPGGIGPPSPLDDSEDSPGIIELGGVQLNSVNARTGTARFVLAGAEYETDKDTISVFVNSTTIASESLTVSPHEISFPYSFADGRNDLMLLASDSAGRALQFEGVVWAGSGSPKITVLDEDGKPFSGADISAVLVDNPNVRMEIKSGTSPVSLNNMPSRTFIFTAHASGGRIATATAIGNSPAVSLRFRAFNTPSTVQNDDFSLGLQGWDVGTAPVKIQTHSELGAQSTAPDQDLVLTTRGEGAQTISRTIHTHDNMAGVSLRYRFVTSEVPGGYFGTKFNDSFSVIIRSKNSGMVIYDSNSMNGLGLGAFSPGGVTAWRTLDLPLSVADDVQIEISVNNTGDGALDSSVIVDRIDAMQIAITHLELNDIDGTPLQQLSCDPHPYFNRNTRIHGKITVMGPPDDALADLAIDVLQGGKVVATGHLADGNAKAQLLAPFGPEWKVEVSTSQLLFEILSDEFGAGKPIQKAKDGTVSLRVRAKSMKGYEASPIEYPRPLPILVRYAKSNRNPDRDENVGGDDWITPNALVVLEALQDKISVGDISNMNGGTFSPHQLHQNGVDVDAKFEGYGANNATATKLLEILNDPTYGKKIKFVYVTFSNTDEFGKAITGVKLKDGRQANAVIQNRANHDTHFHMRIAP